MIFAIGNHIEQIKKGLKTQTRRASDRYEVGKTYAIQPSRTSKAISDGRILITKKREELAWVQFGVLNKISEVDAKAEGGYSSKEFEKLYEKIHPWWCKRFAYTFRFIPKELIE